MNDNARTPAPWVARGSSVFCPGDNQIIADTVRQKYGQLNPDALANARLIAAAPDLLAAVKLMLKHARFYDGESGRYAYGYALATVRKAEGDAHGET